MKSLENYRETEFVGVAELVKQAKDILESAEIHQGSGTVAPFPNDRTVRYYLTEGLIPPADYTEGTASVFSYRHLLALIVIKHLQSQGLSIRIIRRIIANRNIAELEKLLSEQVTVTTDINDARIAEMRGEDVVVISDREEIKEVLESGIGQRTNRESEPDIWERYPIADTIELHISQNSELDKKGKRKLVREIKTLLLSKITR